MDGWCRLGPLREADVTGFSDDDIINRAGVTGSYAMGPGIDLDAGIFYTWGEAADDVRCVRRIRLARILGRFVD